MGWLIVGAWTFIVIHIVVSGTPVRRMIVERTGEGLYLRIFSIASAVTLVWMIIAYIVAPSVHLWDLGNWAEYLALPVMLIACIFLAGSISVPNPTFIGSGSVLENDEAARGFVKITRHPFLWSVTLWALVHILISGDLASVVLFGTLLVVAGTGPGLIDAKRADLYPSDWPRFDANTSNVPFLALLTGRTSLSFDEIGWRPIVIGIGIFIVLLLLHPFVTGVSPVPF